MQTRPCRDTGAVLHSRCSSALTSYAEEGASLVKQTQLHPRAGARACVVQFGSVLYGLTRREFLSVGRQCLGLLRDFRRSEDS